jgi:3-hydroxymyristoyl/3-hydroxydecanoyl-(acyl carrier protein) dehydratase
MPVPTLDTPTSLLDLDATFLPVAQIRQISRVTAVDGPRITGVVDLSPEHWVYSQHFPGDPIFPGTLMLEAAGQLIALWAWAQGLRGRPRLVRIGATFHQPVTPADPQLWLSAEVRSRRNMQFGTVALRAQDRQVAEVEAVMAVLT